MEDLKPSLNWKRIRENVVFSNKYLTLYNDLIEKPDRKQINYLKIKTSDFSTTFCVTKENKVVLVRQYRYAFENDSWECPGGIIDEGESAQDCAIREILEETGYKVLEIESVLKSHPNAYSSALSHTFIAKVEKFTDQNLDENEFIDVREFDLYQLEELLCNNLFIHGPSIIAYLLFKLSIQSL